jgi:hypothetical protein
MALIVVFPAPTALAIPWLPPALLIVATPVIEEDHVTELVTFSLEPSV